MSGPLNPAPAAQTPSGSSRMRLAMLARNAALNVPGVAGAESGPTSMFVTADDQERVEGVRCTAADGSGAYDVSLRLCCEMVSLLQLGQAVGTSVQRAAAAAGIAVAQVSVLIADVVEPEPE